MTLAAVATPVPDGPPPEPSHADAFVELEKVTHTYGRGEREVHALCDTDLRFE